MMSGNVSLNIILESLKLQSAASMRSKSHLLGIYPFCKKNRLSVTTVIAFDTASELKAAKQKV